MGFQASETGRRMQETHPGLDTGRGRDGKIDDGQRNLDQLETQCT